MLFSLPTVTGHVVPTIIITKELLKCSYAMRNLDFIPPQLVLMIMIYSIVPIFDAIELHACLNIPQTFIRSGITCTCYYVDSILMDTVDTGRQLSSTTTSIQWLRRTLLPRITKWAETGCDQLSHASSGTSNNSMRCIDVEVYYSKYTVMKDKYGKAICEVSAHSGIEFQL